MRISLKLALTLILSTTVVFGTQGQRPKKYKLKKGDEFKISVQINQTIEQDLLGKKLKTIQNSSAVDLFEVIEVTKEGFLLKTTGLERSFESDTPQGSTSMNSNEEGEVHLAMRVLVDKPFFIHLTKYGRVMQLSGLDEVRDSIRDELQGSSLGGTIEQMLGVFDEETLTSAIEGQLNIYKRSSKHWERSDTIQVNNLPIAITNKFQRTGKKQITAKGQLSLNGAFDVMGQRMSADLAGEQHSIFTLTKKTGLPTSITTNQEMEGILALQGIDVPMTLTTIVEVKIER